LTFWGGDSRRSPLFDVVRKAHGHLKGLSKSKEVSARAVGPERSITGGLFFQNWRGQGKEKNFKLERQEKKKRLPDKDLGRLLPLELSSGMSSEGRNSRGFTRIAGGEAHDISSVGLNSSWEKVRNTGNHPSERRV